MALGLRQRLQGTGVDKLVRYATSADYRYERRVAGEVLAGIPRARLAEIQAQFAVEDPGEAGANIGHATTRKYLEARTWLENAVQRVTAIDLNTRSPISVLDLGCGAGWFLAVARHFGHRVMGLDLGENRMYNALIEMLEIDRVVHAITPFQPLPDVGQQFDLVTGYMVYFNFYHAKDQPPSPWGIEEWTYFLGDVERLLAPNGRLRLELNRGPRYLGLRPEDEYLPDATAAALRRLPGVTVTPSKGVVELVRG